MRGTISFVCILSLYSCPPAALAQPAETKVRMNDSLVSSDCVNPTPPDPNARPYPFSVSSIRKALDITGDDIEQVNVLVVDNSFYGYKPNEAGDSGPPRLSSRNFPRGFFFPGGAVQGDFFPWLKPGDFSDVSPPNSTAERHGTHVAGIVLGGMYEDSADDAPDETSNLRKPTARSLLLYDATGNKSWIRIAFLNVKYGTDNPEDDPVERLSTLKQAQLSHQDIVNMSLGKELTNTEEIPQLPGKSEFPSLVVTSAGNGGDKLTLDGSGVRAYPAILSVDGDDRVLVVASHDANGQLSSFSNYGMPVNIAAPGCQIKSWTDGDDAAVALSGTSMATAIVTFGAALLRSRWALQESGPAIRNRILASAIYNPDLKSCPNIRQAGSASPPDPKDYCVKDGAKLDIETSLLIARDYIEYDDCGPAGDQQCSRKVSLGELVSVPPAITSSPCVGQIADKLRHSGLSLNGALKRAEGNSFLFAYESGLEVGSKPLQTAFCDVAPDDQSQQIEFDVSGKQMSGPDVTQPRTEMIRLSKLKRLVTRSRK